MPYKSVPKRRKSVRASVSKWQKSHRAERAAYMRKYRRRKRSERSAKLQLDNESG